MTTNEILTEKNTELLAKVEELEKKLEKEGKSFEMVAMRVI